MHERQKKAKPMTLHSYHNDAFFPDHRFSCFRQCSRDSYRQLVELQIPGTGADGQINNNKLPFWSEILHQLRPGESTLIHKTLDICRVKPAKTYLKWLLGSRIYEACLYNVSFSAVVHCMGTISQLVPGCEFFRWGNGDSWANWGNGDSWATGIFQFTNPMGFLWHKL